MGRKLLLLNLLMVVGIVLLAQHLVAAWTEFKSEPRIFASPDSPGPPPIMADSELSSPLGDFMVITERNLFSESRGSEPIGAAEEEEEVAPEFAKLPELISISAIRGEKQAVLTVFAGRRGRESENRTVKLGDDVEGYEVAEIGRDHLILRWKEIEEIIELTRSSSASESRPSGSRQAVRIITVGTAMAAVETTQAEGTEETERGLQVGSVGGNAQAAGGRRGGAGAGAGLSQSRGGRGNLSGRGSLSGRGNNQTNRPNQRGLPGSVGLGTQRPPIQNTQPPE